MVFVPSITLSVIVWNFTCVEAAFLEDKCSLNWLLANYFSLEYLSFGEIEGNFSFNLFIV